MQAFCATPILHVYRAYIDDSAAALRFHMRKRLSREIKRGHNIQSEGIGESFFAKFRKMLIVIYRPRIINENVYTAKSGYKLMHQTFCRLDVKQIRFKQKSVGFGTHFCKKLFCSVTVLAIVKTEPRPVLGEELRHSPAQAPACSRYENPFSFEICEHRVHATLLRYPF